jgi:2-hydroxy-6-oxonona-2,4-dienedioate hydrolase
MLWILGFAVLVAFPLAAAGYSSYRRDLIAARARARSGSRMVTTAVVRSSTPEWVKGHVLVLHGASGGWDQGLACARDLVGHGFQVIAPSRFGYLRTPLPADASAEAEADTWADLLDALHIPRLPVIAVSAGAAPAVQLALRHPPACRTWCCWFQAPAACIRAGPVLLHASRWRRCVASS